MFKRFVSIYIFFVLLVISCDRMIYDNGPEVDDPQTAEEDILSESFKIDKKKINRNEYIAIFGDIQYYTNYIYIHTYRKSLEWIQEKWRRGAAIKCILHTGDVTQENGYSSWYNFINYTQDVAEKIMYISAIGDHDYTWHNTLIDDRDSTEFSNYLNFKKSLENVAAYYEPGRLENIVVKNTIQGERYDILVLEFGPRKEVVEWANEYVSAHKDIKFILLNHEYLESGGGRRTTGLKCVSRLRNTTYTTPDELWDQLIKKNDNIMCVLCGHVGGLYALTLEKNDYGRDVPQIQFNIQSAAYRYDNWLMLWKFPPNRDSVVVSVINAETHKYYNDRDTLFTFRYRYPTEGPYDGEDKQTEDSSNTSQDDS